MNVWISVYRDTIEEHDKDWNLSDILVTEDFARQYFEECKADKYEEHINFDNWIMNYDCDDTQDFYQYAKEHNAIIKLEHLEN